MNDIIVVKNLLKNYIIHKRKPGLINSVKDIFFRQYETVNALKNITFSVKAGELLGYIGPNGAGKTTTLKILSGILHPTKGEVQVMGFTPSQRKKDFLMNISFVMGQKSQLWWDIPPIETFLLNKYIYRIPNPIFQKKLDELVELFKVSHLIYTPVRNLSLGERMKMEIIANLLHEPKILFLDEPTVGLDFLSQDAIRELLLEYNRRYKTTILLTSHYIRDIEILCKRIIIINEGSIVFDGDKNLIMSNFLRERIIKIKFKELPANIENYGSIESQCGRHVEIRITADRLPGIINELTTRAEIEEVLINEVSLEEAIKNAFRNSRN